MKQRGFTAGQHPAKSYPIAGGPDRGSKFWNQPLSQLFAELQTDPTGLTTPEAERRLLFYGPNDAAVAKRPAAWPRLRNRIRNPLVIVLLLASAVSAATGDIASFIIITTIVVLSVLMDFVQEQRAQNVIEGLRDKVALHARVMRDGEETTLATTQLVPGDVVYLAAGDLVPADGRLIAARDFFVNQALLTGEPYPAEKHANESGKPTEPLPLAINAALAGTSVISGTATILVCQTGQATILGQLADTLLAKPAPTAFEVGLRQFSTLILRITALLVFFVLAESMAFQRPWLESLNVCTGACRRINT